MPIPAIRWLQRAHAEERGQTAVVVALSIAVLLGAVALGTEWGFALTQRRVAQNSADASALAAARLLAGNVRGTSSGPQYVVTEYEAYCRALDVARANRSFQPTAPTYTLQVEWAAVNASGSPLLPWQAVASPPLGCASSSSGPLVNRTTVFIRTTATVVYSSPIATLAGKPTLSASARAVARIVGSSLPLDGPSWPMVRHFNASDFQGAPCNPCDPRTIQPVTFWSSGNSPDMTYNSFMGLVDFSRYGPNANVVNGKPSCTTQGLACVPQLITDWDRSGLAPNGKADLVSLFSGGTPCSPPAPATRWLTVGLEDPQNADKQCSLMNWIAYGFGGPTVAGETGPRGALSLTSDYSGVRWDGSSEFREAPTQLPNAGQRSVCAAVPQPLASPSCTDRRQGDWVEAALTGNVGNNAAAALRYFIDQHGVADDFEHTRTGPGNGAPEFGKKVVILVYLWDCAEAFSGSPSGANQWSMITPSRGGADCSDIHSGNDFSNAQIGRVHLFTVAPFTFYRGLVDGSTIRGYWGGYVSGDIGQCATNPTLPSCVINPFANAVFLIAED